MTAYFDAIGKRIGEATRPEDLEKIDYDLVWQCTVCSEFPGFPDDLRTRLHVAVLRFSAAMQPVNHTDPCYESFEEHRRGLYDLNGELHTIFHALSQCNIGGFSDDPWTPLRILYAKGEVRREQMVEEEKAAEKIRQALAALGRTRDEVANTLFAKNALGVRGAACACPVSRYLLQECGLLAIAGCSYTYCRLPGQDAITVQVKTPEPVVEFINAFDMGHHRELETGPEPIAAPPCQPA